MKPTCSEADKAQNLLLIDAGKTQYKELKTHHNITGSYIPQLLFTSRRPP
jgi:hypothetical protein